MPNFFIINTIYTILYFLIYLCLFLILSYLIEIPGNKKLRTITVIEKEKSEQKDGRKAVVKFSFVALLVLIIITIAMHFVVKRIGG